MVEAVIVAVVGPVIVGRARATERHRGRHRQACGSISRSDTTGTR
jgi:hypothetical protein